MDDNNPDTIGRISRRARPIGRTLRVIVGMLLIASIAPFYLRGDWGFNLASGGVVVALIIFYILVHYLVSNHFPGISSWLGAILAFAPLILVYVLGLGEGLIFGSGEGQLGVLTFLGISLVLAGLWGDSGCEVMSIPNALFRKQTHLACLVFSPIDWLEQKPLKG